jgi:two-component system chemotaxis response regulator CheB
MSKNVSVLIIDDSALMRKLICAMIDSSDGLHVIDTAMSGKIGLEKIQKLKPDVVVVDIEMPEMDGIEFLRERKRLGINTPVIVLSPIAEKGATVTMEALALGASDFVTNPSGAVSIDSACVKDRITQLLLAHGGAHKKRVISATPHHHIVKRHTRPTGKIGVIAIGISTGGPEALRTVFSNLDADLPVPILVVQHMLAGFTFEFARSLNKICPLEVKEASEGDEIIAGRILIADGSKHLEVEKRIGGGIVHLTDTEFVNGHKPSIDVLFASVAVEYKNHALGVIMTGMGRDGAYQLGSICREGGLTIGQDEESSIVYGMPRVAFEMGNVMEQVSLENMAERISKIAKESKL